VEKGAQQRGDAKKSREVGQAGMRGGRFVATAASAVLVTRAPKCYSKFLLKRIYQATEKHISRATTKQ